MLFFHQYDPKVHQTNKLTRTNLQNGENTKEGPFISSEMDETLSINDQNSNASQVEGIQPDKLIPFQEDQNCLPEVNGSSAK